MRKKTNQIVQEDNQKKTVKKQSIFQKDIRWERLDNTAHLFPAIAGETMSNVYRFSVTLTDMIEPELLQQALDIVLPKFDGFNVRMRNGVFWYYFEENGKPAPRVKEEERFPCRYIRPNKNNSYLFRVTYYKYRINLEVFHVLTDGMGTINFLRELTYQYLRIRYPELNNQVSDALASNTSLNREDSFLKHYKKSAKNSYKQQKAYLLKGEKLRAGELGVLHGYMSISELKKVCASYHASINEYLVSTYIWSVYTECLKRMPSDKPIRVAVPVNLRPYFDSITTKNFFVMISAEFWPEKESYTFEEIIASVQESLKNQLNREHLEKLFSYNVSNEKLWFARAVPLIFKNIAMRQVYTKAALANTTTITNVGKIDIAKPYQPYVEQVHVFLTISKGQHNKGTICSYGNTLVFTFSYDLKDTSIQRGFFRKLSEDGLHIELESNGVNYE